MSPLGYHGGVLIRTASDLGAVIREGRLKLDLDQIPCQEGGTSRKWLIEVENGKPRAETGLILRTLKTLGIAPEATDSPPKRTRRAAALIQRYRFSHGE